MSTTKDQLRGESMKWILSKDRLPDTIRPVIVTWTNTKPESYYRDILGKNFVGCAHFCNGKWYWYSAVTEDYLAEYGRFEVEEFDEAIKVIAWQEMPYPYDEKAIEDKSMDNLFDK